MSIYVYKRAQNSTLGSLEIYIMRYNEVRI
jgi:hypothetical protein